MSTQAGSVTVFDPIIVPGATGVTGGIEFPYTVTFTTGFDDEIPVVQIPKIRICSPTGCINIQNPLVDDYIKVTMITEDSFSVDDIKFDRIITEFNWIAFVETQTPQSGS
jgi:hypothetical protein